MSLIKVEPKLNFKVEDIREHEFDKEMNYRELVSTYSKHTRLIKTEKLIIKEELSEIIDEEEIQQPKLLGTNGNEETISVKIEQIFSIQGTGGTIIEDSAEDEILEIETKQSRHFITNAREMNNDCPEDKNEEIGLGEIISGALYEDYVIKLDHAHVIKTEELIIKDEVHEIIDEQKTVRNKLSGKRKRKEDTSRRLHKCSQCKKIFQSRNHLRRHMAVHSEEKPYSCDKCHKKFRSESYFKTHMSEHAGENMYRCDKCNKNFSQGSTLKVHMAIHTGEKPYSCQHCGKRFSQNSNLNSHMTVHTRKKPHSCNYCSKQFSHTNDLKKHVTSVHEGIKPFSCNQCQKKFYTNSHLKRHMTTHIKDKCYKCSQCHQHFKRLNQLNKHMNSHNNY